MLYIISTPIGNIRDISLRAIDTFESLDYLLCEDTRVTSLLLNKLGIVNRPKLISFYDEVESSKITEVVSYLREGKNVGLVSDAGTPLISDPGWLLIRKCQLENLSYTALPGASSVVNALVLSGLPTSRFSFLGFLPKKTGQKIKLLSSYKNIVGTKVCFESPYRVSDTLRDIKSVFGDVEIRLCRNMTKINEIVNDPSKKYSNKGEIVIVFS